MRLSILLLAAACASTTPVQKLPPEVAALDVAIAPGATEAARSDAFECLAPSGLHLSATPAAVTLFVERRDARIARGMSTRSMTVWLEQDGLIIERVTADVSAERCAAFDALFRMRSVAEFAKSRSAAR